jgi:exodeoxyribonuclease VII large subunit
VSRLPFDASKMAARKEAAGAGAAKASDGALSVSQLAGMVEGVLRDKLPRPLKVVGEVSGFTDRTHWYFTLKDAGAAVSCVMFKAQAARAGFVPVVGQEVVATGFVDFYVPQGRTTFRVEKLDPVGAGALELAFRALCEELRGLGWFDAARKRPLPVFPRRVAVVTSRTGAALQDVIDTMRRRAPFVEVCLVDTLVQGPAAAPAVAAAVSWVSANAARLGIDTLIVTRGGGSAEDLWAFNDRGVAGAIVGCTIPVAAAIGHETDTTIAELVADARCATPTQAAMRCTPDAAALREQVEALWGAARGAGAGVVRRARDRVAMAGARLSGSVRLAVAGGARRLAQAAARLEARRPARVLAERGARVERLAARLDGAVRGRMAEARPRLTAAERGVGGAVVGLLRAEAERVEGLRRQLELVGPASVLARGYSMTFGPGGGLVRKSGDVRPGEVVTTKLAEGTLRSVVEGTADAGVRHGGRLTGPVPGPAARKRRPSAGGASGRGADGRRGDGEAGLFG